MLPTICPAAPVAYQFEGLSLASFNDNSPFLFADNGLLNVSVGRGPDDQFTAGFHLDTVGSLKTEWSDKLIASSTYAIFTDTQYYAIGITGVPDHPPWRLDTGSVQFLLEKSWFPVTLDYGGGLVVRGNLGGQLIQDGLHGSIGDVQFDNPYATGLQAGPFLAGTLTYPFFDQSWFGWMWTASGAGRGVWDMLGVLNNEWDTLVHLQFESGPTRFEYATGVRLSLPSTAPGLSRMYSSGWFFDADTELSFGDFRVQFGYALNPYGAVPISQYPAYKDQNQEFHWTFIWGKDSPVPWALRFFP